MEEITFAFNFTIKKLNPLISVFRKHCTPTCRQGCVNGTCIQPDVCRCNFGFVGQNCSTMCKCNGHSDCPGPDDLENCIECKNNTFVRFHLSHPFVKPNWRGFSFSNYPTWSTVKCWFCIQGLFLVIVNTSDRVFTPNIYN